jgi:hypothetical protein
MYKTFRRVLAFVVGFTALACTLKAEQMTEKEKQALKVGQEYIAVHYANFDSRNLKPILKDAGDHWELFYELPEMQGGTPVVHIDKRSIKVVRSYRTQ